ncbi:MAG: type II toxin-antitoxin system Phd/YefM family antitoxin [Rhodocyclaceae bacterium]|nr:type II toxin-antitoxin system Phd/YefM family antitoxin [Rhodocyclaceae bacterium]
MRTISATDLARNTRAILDTVAMRGETITVERNHIPIARIVPPESTRTASQVLAGLRTTLTPQQGEAWLAERDAGFDETVRDPWA